VRRLLLILLPALLLAACGGGGGSGAKATNSSPAPAPPAKTANGCERVSGVEQKTPPKLAKPKTTLDPAKTWTATVDTTCGTFAIRLAVKRAPKTTASFASLVRKGFYDGLVFHRISEGFVIQGGDPNGDGSGGPGYTVVEPPPKTLHYTRGVVAMAKTQTEPSGASGSQFFVTLAEDASAEGGLTPDYALLGKVSKGLAVVQKIGITPADPSTEKPKDPVVIRKITLSSS
jgi:peptidyl-prolyl cis-trans isomerase B (cyclophilin B)